MSVKTIAEIEKIRENTLNEIGARFGMTDFAGARIHIMTCGGAGCHSSGSGRLLENSGNLQSVTEWAKRCVRSEPDVSDFAPTVRLL